MVGAAMVDVGRFVHARVDVGARQRMLVHAHA